MMDKNDFKKEYMADSLVNLSKFVLPDFEMPNPGEGVQNGASDFILREFTNERLFKELQTGKYVSLAKAQKMVENTFDFADMKEQIAKKAQSGNMTKLGSYERKQNEA